MNPSVLAYLIAVVVFAIITVFYRRIMKRHSVFWNWAGAFVLSIGLVGVILKLIEHKTFKEIFSGIIFVLIGLSLYVFPRHSK